MGDNIWSCYVVGKDRSSTPLFGQPLTHFNLVGKKHISDLQHLGNMFIVFVAMKKTQMHN